MIPSRVEEKLKRRNRKYKQGADDIHIELFCTKCGKSLGQCLDYYDLCKECANQYIKECTRNLYNYELDKANIIADHGNTVAVRHGSEFCGYTIIKQCYFTKKGRYINVKGKRYYI